MRLTHESEIAIGLLPACARASGERVQTKDAATALGITRAHAAKIVHILMVAGFLITTRGRVGGISLAMPAEMIPLAAVLQRMQPDALAIGVRRKKQAAVLAHLDVIVGSVHSRFIALMEHLTIADLAAEPKVCRLTCVDCRFFHAAHRMTPGAAHHACKERADTHAPSSHG